MKAMRAIISIHANSSSRDMCSRSSLAALFARATNVEALYAELSKEKESHQASIAQRHVIFLILAALFDRANDREALCANMSKERFFLSHSVSRWMRTHSTPAILYESNKYEGSMCTRMRGKTASRIFFVQKICLFLPLLPFSWEQRMRR